MASELRRGRPVRGHLDGGRACLLATRVSRSVRLSVCEAVIRFQDFPSVTGLLTNPCTPLHGDNSHHLNLSTLGLIHLSGQEPPTPATTPRSLLSQTGNLNLAPEFFSFKYRCKTKAQELFSTLVYILPLSFSPAHFSSFISACSPPLPPLDGRSGSELCGLRGGKDAAVHINNERPQPPPPRHTHTHTGSPPIAMAMALAQHSHRGGRWEYSYSLQRSTLELITSSYAGSPHWAFHRGSSLIKTSRYHGCSRNLHLLLHLEMSDCGGAGGRNHCESSLRRKWKFTLVSQT